MDLNSTSQILQVRVRDSAGEGVTGLVAADMSGSYTRQDNSAPVAFSFSDVAIGAPYSSGGWVEAEKGLYLYHFPDACWTVEGMVSFRFSSGPSIDSTPWANVQKPWVKVGNSYQYTNTESNPGGNFDKTTITPG